MSALFLLGAGFSKAVHHQMPLLVELSREVRQRATTLSAARPDLPPPLPDLGDDIELWLTYLSQPQPWLKEAHNLENRAMFLRISGLIGDILNGRTAAVVVGDEPQWLSQTVQWWHEHQSNVITLNYDTLIERAANRADISTGNIYPVPMTDVRRVMVAAPNPGPTLKLFKLHGSVNWYYSGAPSFHGEVLYDSPVAPWGERSNENERQARLSARDKVPLIVPPTTEKAEYFQHESVRHIWLQASQALQSASRVYCVGYSLPQTDLGIRFLLLHSRPNQKVSLFVVNKTNEPEALKARYEALLGNSYEINTNHINSGADILPQILS